MSDKYYDVSEDIIDQFMKLYNNTYQPIDIDFLFIGNSKQKTVITVKKIPDDIVFALGGDKKIKVTINENLLYDQSGRQVFDDEAVNILFEQEINKIEINGESGKVKLKKSDLVTFSEIVSKHGIEAVSRANQVEQLYNEQKVDSEENFIG